MTEGLPAPGMPWTKGRDVIVQLIADGRLDRVVADPALVRRQLDYADQFLAAAIDQVDRYPMSAFTSAYDACRQMFTAVLENQGLRVRADRGHLTVEEAVSAQVDPGTGRRFRALRMLRHASEYPTLDRSGADEQSARDAISFAQKMRPAVTTLIAQMGVFR